MSEVAIATKSSECSKLKCSNKEIKIRSSNSYNPNLEVNLDSDIIFRSCDINMSDVPENERYPPPLTKRLNIELEKTKMLSFENDIKNI